MKVEEDSLKKRYLAKLSTNFVGLLIALVTQSIIPRGLGPKAYGDFNFLTNFFTEVTSFLDMGTSIGFYTKVSQRQDDFGIVSFYFRFTVLTVLIIGAIVAIVHFTGNESILWPDQKIKFVYMASIWGALTWISMVLIKLTDAYGETVVSEKVRILQKSAGIFLILLLYYSETLDLTNFFYFNYIIIAFLIILLIYVLNKKKEILRESWRLTNKKLKSYTKEFYNYSYPLFIYALVGLAVGVLDRWILQYFSGSIEQGFFGLSYQIGAVCFVFSSAMTPLITRSFSIAYNNNDIKEMASVFRRYLPLLYAVAAYLSCFVSIQAEAATLIVGGGEFKGALIPVSLMALYPIHQTYGQLSGSVFYATGNTKLYRNIGIFCMILGLPMTYFFMAPSEYLGLSLGASGLAFKLLAFNFILVNIQLYYNSIKLKLNFFYYFVHQFVVITVFLSISFFVKTYVYKIYMKLGIQNSFIIENKIIILFFISGLIYSLLILFSIVLIPQIIGMNKKEFLDLIKGLKLRQN